MLVDNMKKFLDGDFLLENELAKSLYENNKDLPIFDYHCHLEAKDIYENKKFENLTKLWLFDNGTGDHYKWRLMRSCGVDEKYITGNANDFDKFYQFAKNMPLLLGNSVYVWCHLELRKYFNIYDEINEENARKIYDLANEKLKTIGARDFIINSNVKYLFTTDDPLDDLKYHKMLKEEKLPFEVYPCFRADNFLKIDCLSFSEYIQKLQELTDIKITSLDKLKDAIRSRIDYFVSHNCLAADIGIDSYLPYESLDEKEIDKIFLNSLKGKLLFKSEIDAYKTEILRFLMIELSKRNLVCELHIGPLRNISKLNFKKFGKDSGFDIINNQPYVEKLAKLFSDVESKSRLPKTIVFPINDNDYETILSLLGAFSSNRKGSMQLGPAWWFNDHYDGIIKNLTKQSNYLPLGNMIGMLTDSRSFTSYIRHDYFRRILCSFIARLVINGAYPNNIEQLNKMVKNVFYDNSEEFFLGDD